MPNPAPAGRIVEFSATLQPSSKLQIVNPGEVAPPTAEEAKDLHRGTKGGILLMRILSMSLDDRRAFCADQAADPLMCWFAGLSVAERRQFVAAAEQNLKQVLATAQEKGEA